ncbi:MAG: cytochrome c [Chlorobi bacterium]|nr:cytochrome c [Chlorobiota bacterium]
MTNAQKWVSIFLVLFVILLALSKLTSRNEDETTNSSDKYNSTQTEQMSQAEILISNNKCMDCHGQNLDGSASGPSLAKVGQNWTKEDLLTFLKNPPAFSDDPRIQQYKGKYRKSMPAVDKMNDNELNILADHLMNLK